MSEQLPQKLLVPGIRCIFSDGADSTGIFENNPEDSGVRIAISRSGRSRTVLNRVKTARVAKEILDDLIAANKDYWPELR